MEKDAPLNILIIEDEPDVARSMKLMLQRKLSATCEVAENCAMAWEKFSSNRFDIVTLDYQLPDGTGIELLQRIRSEENPPPVIMVTGHGSEEIAAEALNLGASAYIIKESGLSRALPKAIEQALFELRLKRAEEALRLSEDRYRSFIENFPGIAFRGMRDFSVDFMHGKVEEITGYAPEEFVFGQVIWKDVVHADDLPGYMEEIEKDMDSGRPFSTMREYRIIRKDGETRWVAESTQSISDESGNLIGTQGIVYDITSRKESQQQLELSNTALDTAGDLFAVIGTDGSFHRYNRSFLETTGYSGRDLSELTIFDLVSEEELARLYEKLEEARKKGHAELEIELLTKDGDSVPIELSGSIILDGRGNIVALSGIGRDLTERREAEKALKASEEKYRFIADNMRDIVWTVDMDLKTTYVSPSIEAVLGFTPEERLGQAVKDQITPESLGLATETIAAELERDGKEGVDPDRSVLMDLDYYHKDGSTVCLENMVSGIRDRDGNVIGFLGLSRDVTERKEARLESERVLGALGERVKELGCLYGLSKLIEKPDITLQGILEGSVELMPPAWQYPESTWSRVEFLGDAHSTDNYTEKGARLSSDIYVFGERVGTLQVGYTEEKPAAEDGPFLADECKLIEAVAERLGKVAERILAADYLAEEKAFSESAIDSLVDVFYVLKPPEAKLVRWNRRAAEVSGYSDEELSKMTVYDFFDLQDQQRQNAFFKELVGEGRASIEASVVTKDGRRIPYEFISTLVRDERDEPKFVIGVGRDIRERKRAEAELQKVNTELEGFAHTVSHDLKAPLSSIGAAAQVMESLLRDPQKITTADFREALDIIGRNLEKSNLLIEDLLSLAETGISTSDVEDVDVSAVVKRILDEKRAEIETGGIEFEVDPDLGKVRANKTHVSQVFSNLIKNAIQHNDSEEPEVKILCRGIDDSGARRFLVCDNGSGIPADMMDRIYEPFFKGKGGDTGIGLSIVKRLVELYGGTIQAHNDDGACFEFTLCDFKTEERDHAGT